MATAKKLFPQPDVFAVINKLMRKSQWFTFQPMPDDMYEVTVYAENAHLLEKRPGELDEYTVIGFHEDNGQIVAHQVMAKNGMHAFGEAAGIAPGMTMVASIAGALMEGEGVEYPGEGLVDADTVLEQSDVFGDPDEA